MPLATTHSEDVTVMNEYVTMQTVCAMFNRSAESIILWRKHKGLPYIRIPGDGRDTIRFDRLAITKWAKDHSVALAGRVRM